MSMEVDEAEQQVKCGCLGCASTVDATSCHADFAGVDVLLDRLRQCNGITCSSRAATACTPLTSNAGGGPGGAGGG